jgi:hypothetical protein
MASEKSCEEVSINGYPRTRLFKWSLANGDWGYPVMLPRYSDKTVQVSGTFGVGGTILIEGSVMRDSPVFETLNDSQGNALSFTGPKIEAIVENPYQVRPIVTVGDGTTAIDVYLLVKE